MSKKGEVRWTRQEQMNRLQIFTIVAVWGFTWPPQSDLFAQSGKPSTNIQVIDGKKITFDPKTCTNGVAGFGWALGSVRVEVLGTEKGQRVFDYTDEVEGGYVVYRCRVPLGAGPVIIELGTIKESASSSPGIVTSFSLKGAKVARKGNVHLGWQEVQVGETGQFVGFQTVSSPDATLPEKGVRLKLRFKVFADADFALLAQGALQDQLVERVQSGGKGWKWIEVASEGMRVGERRRIRLPAKIAEGARKWAPNLKPDSTLHLEMELLAAERP